MDQPKLKVIWICHFSNSFIREQLPLSAHYNYADLAPWITQMINQFKNFDDIELHIIAPHIGLKKSSFNFKLENVNYYFYRNPFAIFKSKFLQLWGSRLNKLFLNKYDRYSVKRIFDKNIKFKPDIINLIGFENPSYSTGILEVKHIPVLITVQGIYSDPENFKSVKEDKIRSYLERSIIKRNKYYSIAVPFFSELIKRDRNDALFLWNLFPRDLPIFSTESINKEFDFVFFARITPLKGTEDLIDAMIIVKKVKPDVSLLILGPGDPGYIAILKKKYEDLGLSPNITFLGEQESMAELHHQALKARFCVLPTRVEGIAGSVLESMYMGLPVITTNAGGHPYLNKDGETVLMTDPMDVPALANNMTRLLTEPELAERLIPAAKSFLEKEFDHYSICRKYVKQYNAVINHYRSGVDIPRDLLFTPQTK